VSADVIIRPIELRDIGAFAECTAEVIREHGKKLDGEYDDTLLMGMILARAGL
jgi:hypothetical protein